MHILTKIFIVLVTLLAVAMVPLVATYTTNENSYRAKYRAANDQQRVAMIRAGDAETELFAQGANYKNEIDLLVVTVGSLQSDKATAQTNLLSSKAKVIELDAQIAQINANINALSSSSEVNSKLKDQFVKDNYKLRQDLMGAEQMVMEMEADLETARTNEQGSLRATRKAKEEQHGLEEQLDKLRGHLNAYVSKYGELETVAVVDNGLAPDRTLASTVLTVSRTDDDVLVEINAGSRDGVQNGWIMTVGHNGTFLGRLQVEQVDINRSIGRVTLEDPTRGLVVPGSSVYAVKGRN